jgi:hypothetical protein
MAAEAEFSADLSITTPQGAIVTGKVFVKESKKRNELTMLGRPAVTILRQDKKLTWVLLPTKAYRELPLQFDPLHPGSDSPYETKELGTEKANGYDCKKILWTFKDPEKGSVLQWWSPELKTAVRYQAKNKGGATVNTTDYKNIKLGPQDNSLFELPEGYMLEARQPRQTRPKTP